MRLAPVAALITATTILAAAAGAQASSAPKENVISIQPLSAVFGIYSAEYEHAVAPTLTLGLGGSYWSLDDDFGTTDYGSVDVKLRYYPEAHPLQGFSFGGQAGYTTLSDKVDYGAGAGSDKNKASGPSLGLGLDYGWLLGASKSFYIGLGVGAKKIFVSNKDLGDVRFAYPTGRVSIGYGF